MLLLEANGLKKTFGRRTVVDGVNLEVGAQEIVGLLGPNGAGKTTSIKSMLGMCEPQAGQVRVLGMDPIRDGHEIRKRVGYVPEQPSLYDWMTVQEAGWFASGFYAEGYLSEYRRLMETFALPAKQNLPAVIRRHSVGSQYFNLDR